MSTAKQVAALALAKCAAYDPWFPKPDPAMVEAWSELLERHRVTREEALQAVTRMYDEHGSGFKPLVRDLIRAVRVERNARPETQDEIDARNLANDKRLGLETDWARGLTEAEIATSRERRAAIEAFVQGFGLPDGMSASVPASAPTGTSPVLPPQMLVKVAENEPQPQEPPPEPDSDDCPHCHFPSGCLVDHVCLGMDYRR